MVLVDQSEGLSAWLEELRLLGIAQGEGWERLLETLLDCKKKFASNVLFILMVFVCFNTFPSTSASINYS